MSQPDDFALASEKFAEPRVAELAKEFDEQLRANAYIDRPCRRRSP